MFKFRIDSDMLPVGVAFRDACSSRISGAGMRATFSFSAVTGCASGAGSSVGAAEPVLGLKERIAGSAKDGCAGWEGAGGGGGAGADCATNACAAGSLVASTISTILEGMMDRRGCHCPVVIDQTVRERALAARKLRYQGDHEGNKPLVRVKLWPASTPLIVPHNLSGGWRRLTTICRPMNSFAMMNCGSKKLERPAKSGERGRWAISEGRLPAWGVGEGDRVLVGAGASRFRVNCCEVRSSKLGTGKILLRKGPLCG